MASESSQSKPECVPAREILRFFSPRWFIAIMGTGALANIFQLIADRAPIWHHLAVGLMTLCLAAYPVVLALLICRLWLDRGMVVKELRHSSLVQFYSAVFIAAAICATGLLKIPLPYLSADTALFLAKGFWGFAAVVGAALAVFTPWRIITLNHGEPRRILGFWFLPPVGLFVLVFAGNFLALQPSNIGWIEPMAVFNALALGIASFQTLALFTLFLFRGLAYPFPREDVVPSFTIGMAPVGVSIIAFLSYQPLLAKAAIPGLEVAAIVPLIKLGCVLLWGFGLWWLLVNIGIIATAYARKGIPVTLGYWAFVFPPAAYTIASILLGQATGIEFIQKTGFVLAMIMAAVWCVIFLLTIRAVFNRRIFILPPSFQELLAGDAAPQDGLTLVKFQDKFPVFRIDIRKSDRLRSAADVVEAIKKKIVAHPVAKHIADFDHFNHTKAIGGEMPSGLVNAVNVVFCFGPKIDDVLVLGVRPRAFGIGEFKEHFSISFMESPSPQATDTMKDWAQSLAS